MDRSRSCTFRKTQFRSDRDGVLPVYFVSRGERRVRGRIEDHFDTHGFGLWSVDFKGSNEFIGYVGLWPATFEAHFTPAIEVGWRLAKRFWGSGLATEAARSAITDGFDRLRFDEIVSFTSAINERSRRVMEKLGMTQKPGDDFDHPSVTPGDPLRPHVLCRLKRSQ